MKENDVTLHDLLASVVNALGYEFVGSELHSSGGSTMLRVYIDRETGFNLDDCAKVSRQISAMLDVEDPIKGKYTLEVSSPGINRPLFEIAHYQKFIGSRVKVRLQSPLDGRRNFVGFLLRVEGTDITLQVDAEEIVLPFSNIEKAKVDADIG